MTTCVITMTNNRKRLQLRTAVHTLSQPSFIFGIVEAALGKLVIQSTLFFLYICISERRLFVYFSNKYIPA